MTKTFEISLRFASKAQDAMKDVVRLLSTEDNNLRQDSSNTLTYEEIDDPDHAIGYDIMDALMSAGVPEDEIFYSEYDSNEIEY